MLGYVVAFLVVTILYVASCVVRQYVRNCRGRNHELLKGVVECLELGVMLTFTWWIHDGGYLQALDLGDGWWMLISLVGFVVAECLGAATRGICNRIWPVDADRMIDKVRMPTRLRALLDVLLFLCSLGFTIMFAYALCFGNASKGVGTTILLVLAIALFAFGTVDGACKIMAWRKQRKGGWPS